MRRIALPLALLAVALLAPDARAAGAVLGAEPITVRVAIEPGVDRTTRWFHVGVGGAAPFVWVLPIGREAAVDDASSAWLEALDVVTAPRVVPACGGGPVHVVRLPDLGATAHSSSAVIARSSAELDAALDGVFPSAELRARMDALLASRDLLVVRASGPTSPTVRVVDRDDAIVPMALTSSPRDVDVVAWVLGDRRAAIGVDAASPSPVHWFGGTSDWVLARDATLARAGSGAFVTESAISGFVVDGQRVSPNEVPALADEYFRRTAALSEAVGSPASCANAARAMATSLAPLACARASLAGAPLAPCSTSSSLTCGSLADDLALGLGGLVPKTAWVTRLVGRVPAGDAMQDLPVRWVAGDPVPLMKVALGGCKLPPPSGTTGSSGGAPDNGSSGGGSWGGSSSDSCGGSVDTSSGGSDTSDDCSGDTSTSSSDDSCDSDTGSSGDSCDSGSGSGDACSGGGGGGDSCDSAAPKKQARLGGGGKSPLSRATLGAAFVAFGLRRWRKRRA